MAGANDAGISTQQKRPLTMEEQVLIFAIGKAIQEGRIVSVIRRDK